ncbi:hypothetical protein [Streptomyces sp. NPDC001750]|uniref:hypothetical protein n=1 Tax=Streptomyces sp. NPDC001750 TaxID=3364607 RepID=UPI003694F930
MLPCQPAGVLCVPEEDIEAMEAGHIPFTPSDVGPLCRLYKCDDDADALRGLLGAARYWADDVTDTAPGHHRRLTGCARQAEEMLWLAADRLPPFVQTPAYAAAAGSQYGGLPGVPLPLPARSRLLLDEHVLLTEDFSPEVMVSQLKHLLGQKACEVRVVPGRVQRGLGPVVVLRMAAAHVLAVPSPHGVGYRPDGQPPRGVVDAWNSTTPGASQYLLQRAVQQHARRQGAAAAPETGHPGPPLGPSSGGMDTAEVSDGRRSLPNLSPHLPQ